MNAPLKNFGLCHPCEPRQNLLLGYENGVSRRDKYVPERRTSGCFIERTPDHAETNSNNNQPTDNSRKSDPLICFLVSAYTHTPY
jgi:hypothetical protein